MAMRWGPGPVFHFDWLMISRRWQVYAVRSLFVAALLVNLGVVWLAEVAGHEFVSWRELAEVGRLFFLAIVGTQLALVFLAAPVATAGCFCLERTRGTLQHLLVTDLSNVEIVFGKLCARLAPIVAMVVCSVPVLAISSLLGGIDPQALLGALLITIGTAVIGCSLALCLSVWAKSLAEVLLATYAAFMFWILAAPIWAGCRLVWPRSVFAMPLPTWVVFANPFWLAVQPYIPPGAVRFLPSRPVSLADDLIYLGGSVLVSLVFLLITIWSLRGAALRHANKSVGVRTRLRAWRSRLPGPSLDGNPVLWREWHRRRPSRWIRAVWGLYAVMTSLFSAAFCVQNLTSTTIPLSARLSPVLNAFQVAVGLMLASVTAATSLAEERAGASLEILLATPLPTRSIVLGKWWGSFRVVPWLALWPAMLALTFWNRAPLGLLIVLVLVAQILAEGAAISSLGLAMATWVRRLDRALGLTVAAYVLVTAGWVFLVLVLIRDSLFSMGLVMASPFFGALFPSLALAVTNFEPAKAVLIAGTAWATAYSVAALLLLLATLATFDRCTGRITGARPARTLSDGSLVE